MKVTELQSDEEVRAFIYYCIMFIVFFTDKPFLSWDPKQKYQNNNNAWYIMKRADF